MHWESRWHLWTYFPHIGVLTAVTHSQKAFLLSHRGCGYWQPSPAGKSMKARHLELLLRHHCYYLSLMVFNIKFQFLCSQLCPDSIIYLSGSGLLYRTHWFSARPHDEAENWLSNVTLGRSNNLSELSFLIDHMGIITSCLIHLIFTPGVRLKLKKICFHACVVKMWKMYTQTHTHRTHTTVSPIHITPSLQFLG